MSNLVQVEESNPFLTSKIRRKPNTPDARILFLYPNERGMSTIPPSIAGLSQILKNENHITSLFDTTFYKFDDELAIEDSDLVTQKVLTNRPVLDIDDDDLYFKKTTRSAINDFRSAVTGLGVFGGNASQPDAEICPEGWHVPSDDEWQTLITFLGGESIAGKKLKESGSAHWNSPNTATNESGFTALPGGICHGTLCWGMGDQASFWTSTNQIPSINVCYDLWNYTDNVEIDGSGSSVTRYRSIRCLKD